MRWVRPLAGDVQNLLGAQLNGVISQGLLDALRTSCGPIHMRRMHVRTMIGERPSINDRIDRV
jgi:hypothetical protein